MTISNFYEPVYIENCLELVRIIDKLLAHQVTCNEYTVTCISDAINIITYKLLFTRCKTINVVNSSDINIRDRLNILKHITDDLFNMTVAVIECNRTIDILESMIYAIYDELINITSLIGAS